MKSIAYIFLICATSSSCMAEKAEHRGFSKSKMENEVARSFHDGDKDKDNFIEFDEFVTMSLPKNITSEQYTVLRAAAEKEFRELDHNADGRLSIAEYSLD